jgi:hypothetical protein
LIYIGFQHKKSFFGFMLKTAKSANSDRPCVNDGYHQIQEP